MIGFPEIYRIQPAHLPSKAGNSGAFRIGLANNHNAFVIASNGMGWEHVSVVIHGPKGTLTPTWDQMCYIKDLFWDKEDCVVQYHPAKSDYVNNHPNCLHLWRPVGHPLVKPPTFLVGLGAPKKVD